MALDGSVSAPLLTVAAAAVAYFSFCLYNHRRRFDGLPKPPHSFFWGHLKLMGEIAATMPPNMHPQSYITEISRKYDLTGVWYLDLWPIADPQVIMTEPELMDAVQVNNNYNQHPLAAKTMNPVLGKNAIPVVNGPVWKKLHKAMAPAFSWAHIRSLHGVMADEGMIFRDTLTRLAESGETFSFETECGKVIFDIIGRLVLHTPLNAQTGGSAYLDDILKLIKIADMALSMNPLVKLKYKMEGASVTQRIDSSIKKRVRERLDLLQRENMVPTRRDPHSVMDLMLRETMLQYEEAHGKQGTSGLPEDELQLIVTNLKALMLGGLGTIVDSLCYTIMLVYTHPDVLQKLREEHNRVFDPSLTETLKLLESSPNKLSELEYTTCVAREAMRLFPVGFNVKEAPQGATVTYENQAYPIDDLVIVPCWHTMHYNEKYFPDPTSFKPERFLNDAVPRGWFRTFSRGHRQCSGQNLGQEIMRAVLLMIVRDFDFELADLKPNPKPTVMYTDLDTKYGDIIFQYLAVEARPRGGMMLKVKKAER